MSKKPYQIRNAEIIPLFQFTEQKCSKCFLIKPLEDFVKDKFSKGGRRSFCKICKNKSDAPRREKQREVYKSRYRERDVWLHRQRKFGLTKEAYFLLLADQRGACAICKISFPQEIAHRNIHIDHNHETGKVRGILCMGCNNGLGALKDNITILKNAAQYLEEKGSYGSDKKDA